jgi:3-oxosteroid 1-dehydrogenase
MPNASSGRLSRRGFIHRSVAASAVVATAGATSVASAAAPRKWEQQADVLIVGSGAAALAAAVGAVQSGASVIVLEKGPTAGGTTIKSDGAYWIPNNHHMQAKGIADPKDDALRYMASSSYPLTYRGNQPRFGLAENEYALVEAYYDNAAPAISALEGAGAIQSTMVELVDYYDHSPLNKAPRGRILLPKIATGPYGNGRELIRQLRAWLDARHVPILLRHAVTDVIKNDDGEVIGVQVKRQDGTVSFRARKAVIFGSGGYTQNPELVANHQPGPIFGGCAVPTNQGDLIDIGIRAGTKLGNMVNAWRAQLVVEEALQVRSVSRDIWQPPGDSMVLVNKYGMRVVDEKRNYHDRARAHFTWDASEAEYPNRLLFMVYDARTADLFAGNFPLPAAGTAGAHVISAPTFAELGAAIQKRLDSYADQIGPYALAPEFGRTLTAEIERFNADAKTGKDTRFGRGKYPYDAEWQMINSVPREPSERPKNSGPNPTLFPFEDKGPYFAIILGAGTLDTNGGPVINAKAQMLDTRGQPIPGLYGAGNCVASPAAAAYWGAGGTIGPAMTFGTIAARHAVAERVKKES